MTVASSNKATVLVGSPQQFFPLLVLQGGLEAALKLSILWSTLSGEKDFTEGDKSDLVSYSSRGFKLVLSQWRRHFSGAKKWC